jgi:hypothetical protein
VTALSVLVLEIRMIDANAGSISKSRLWGRTHFSIGDDRYRPQNRAKVPAPHDLMRSIARSTPCHTKA